MSRPTCEETARADRDEPVPSVAHGPHPGRVTGGPIPADRPGRELASVTPLLFAGDGREPRRRRVADAALAAAATGALVLAALASEESAGDQAELVEAAGRLLGWLEPLWTACYGAASAVCAALVVVALGVGRRALARDIGVAVVLTLGTDAGLAQWVDGSAPGLSDMVWAVGDPSYPARLWPRVGGGTAGAGRRGHAGRAAVRQHRGDAVRRRGPRARRDRGGRGGADPPPAHLLPASGLGVRRAPVARRPRVCVSTACPIWARSPAGGDDAGSRSTQGSAV